MRNYINYAFGFIVFVFAMLLWALFAESETIPFWAKFLVPFTTTVLLFTWAAVKAPRR